MDGKAEIEIKTLLEHLGKQITTGNLDTAKQIGEVSGTLKHIESRVAEVIKDVDFFKREFPAVKKASEEATMLSSNVLNSHNQLDKKVEDSTKELKEGHKELKGILLDQNKAAELAALKIKADAEAAAMKIKTDLEERDRKAKDELVRESIAAKRVEEKRRYRENMSKIYLPAFLAVITTVGASYFAGKQGHAETSSKLDETNAKVAQLTKALEIRNDADNVSMSVMPKLATTTTTAVTSYIPTPATVHTTHTNTPAAPAAAPQDAR
jgi:uncharacterized protein YyaL (SSP411 family)